MSGSYYVDPEKARSIGLQNWARSYAPTPREIPALEAAGIPARGPVARWSPRGVAPPNKLYNSGSSLFFGQVYQPRDFPSRWLGVHPETGAAMRSSDPIQRGGRNIQRMDLKMYGGESPAPFRFSDPVAGILEDGRLRRQQTIEGPGFEDSWQRADPHVLWGLDEPGRYGIQRPHFRGGQG